MDSGCSYHFLLLLAPCRNWRETNKLIRITIPSGKALESTHEGDLNIEVLPEAAWHPHIWPGLANHYLLSVRKNCNAGCQVLFQINKVVVFDAADKAIMVGHWVPMNIVWMVYLMYIEMEDRFNDNSILGFACSMVREDRPHMSIKGRERRRQQWLNTLLSCIHTFVAQHHRHWSRQLTVDSWQNF